MQEEPHALDVGTVDPDNMDDLMQKIADHKGCGTKGGSGKSSCGSSAGQRDLPSEIWE